MQNMSATRARPLPHLPAYGPSPGRTVLTTESMSPVKVQNHIQFKHGDTKVISAHVPISGGAVRNMQQCPVQRALQFEVPRRPLDWIDAVLYVGEGERRRGRQDTRDTGHE